MANNEPQTIVVDSPLPPQKTVIEQRYVPYETDEFQKSYHWASEQVARKYPGAVEILDTLNSLIAQHTNASK